MSKFHYYFYIRLFPQIPPFVSTKPYFLPPFGVNHEVVPPLLPEGSLTIGYSSDGSNKVHPGGSGPFVYECRPEQDVDVGFLKLFLSNQYIDLSNILQGVTTALDEGNVRRTKIPESRGPEPTWVSMVVTVVQERKK